MATSFPPYSAPSAAGANAPTPASGTGPQPPAGPRNGVNSHSNRIDVISTVGGRILCIADVRGGISMLNTLAAQHQAVAIIHSGDFGFYEPASLSTMSERTLRHLVQYSSLISSAFRSQLLAPATTFAQMRALLLDPPRGSFPDSKTGTDFGLSEFPKLLSGELKLSVPVYTVWGACEDVAILEKIRAAGPSPVTFPGALIRKELPASYAIPNLTVLDEATTRVLTIGGVRLRLFGLGGAVVSHKLFDNGTGTATIAGGAGTMWTTMLQIGEIVDTAQKVYDQSETRLLISHASPGREGLLSQLSLVLKADLTLSAGLHFRYGVSYNEFSVQHDSEAFRGKLEYAKKSFNEVWDTVKGQVEGVIDENQRALLTNALAVANRVPAAANATNGQALEEAAWKNCWNWNLPDAAFGSLVLDIRDGRIGTEQKSQGFNFSYRQSNPNTRPPTSQAAASTVPPHSSAATPIVPDAQSAIAAVAPTSALPPSVPTSTRPAQVPRQQNNLSYPNNIQQNRPGPPHQGPGSFRGNSGPPRPNNFAPHLPPVAPHQLGNTNNSNSNAFNNNNNNNNNINNNGGAPRSASDAPTNSRFRNERPRPSSTSSSAPPPSSSPAPTSKGPSEPTLSTSPPLKSPTTDSPSPVGEQPKTPALPRGNSVRGGKRQNSAPRDETIIIPSTPTTEGEGLVSPSGESGRGSATRGRGRGGRGRGEGFVPRGGRGAGRGGRGGGTSNGAAAPVEGGASPALASAPAAVPAVVPVVAAQAGEGKEGVNGKAGGTEKVRDW